MHHIDDNPAWQDHGELHPLHLPTAKPVRSEWACPHGCHEYDVCRCHLEQAHMGGDESAFDTNAQPHRRWGIDDRSYKISKSRGGTVMAAVHKETSTGRGFALKCTAEELALVNEYRVGKYYLFDPTRAKAAS